MSAPAAAPAGQQRSRASVASLHARHVSWILVAAFTLSVVHTVYAWRNGLEDPGFTVTTPTTYLFYALGFGAAAVARRPRRSTQAALLGYLLAVLSVSVLYYPTTFTPRQQTTFAWFENDVYVGLLLLATYLVVVDLLGVRLVRLGRPPKDASGRG